MATRRRRLHREARWAGRYGFERHPGHAAHRRAGRAPHRLPAHAELQHSGPSRRLPARRSVADQTALRRDLHLGAHIDRTAMSVSAEEREAILEGLWEEGGFKFLWGSFSDLLIDPEANEIASEFIRNKIRATVQDPRTAELLCPKGYPYGAKRPPIDTEYYETFNRDNVTLVDISEQPIEAITPIGLRTSDAEFALDAIVFATGFDAMTGSLVRMD